MTALAQSRRVEGRVETLLAVLALAGEEGIAEEDRFAQTYGFGYVGERRRTVFDVLIHRARAFVEGHAIVRRGRGVLRLEPLRSRRRARNQRQLSRLARPSEQVFPPFEQGPVPFERRQEHAPEVPLQLDGGSMHPSSDETDEAVTQN